MYYEEWPTKFYSFSKNTIRATWFAQFKIFNSSLYTMDGYIIHRGTTSRSCVIIIDGQLLRVFVDVIQAFKLISSHVCYILITYNTIDTICKFHWFSAWWLFYIFPEILTACEMVTCKCITSQYFFIILTVTNSKFETSSGHFHEIERQAVFMFTITKKGITSWLVFFLNKGPNTVT